MSTDPNHQSQYPPPQWESHPQRGAYPIAQQPVDYRTSPSSQSYHSIPPASGPGEMVTLPPPQHQHHPPPDLYRPPMYDMYVGHPQDPHRPPPPHIMYQNQPAPRQRTAIACRYCRRRKIRCSGFEASEDGRCTNCQRFQQECIFTPVSSQAQAFVPAHTAYPHLRTAGPMPPQRGRAVYPQPGQPPAIYGAHGQPLGHLPPGQDPHYPPTPQQYMQGGSPTGMYPGNQPPRYDDGRGPPPPTGGPPHHPHPTHERVSRKRPRTDESSHPSSSVPPTEMIPVSQQQPPYQTNAAPNPSNHPRVPGRRGSAGGQYEYPDPSALHPVSPASSATSYHSAAPYATQQNPYYTQPPPQPPPQQQGGPPLTTARRPGSPTSTSYSYEARTSGSPHGSTTSSTGGGNFHHPYQATGGLHPPQVLPPTANQSGRGGGDGNSSAGGRTPPSAGRDGSSNGRSGGGMAVKDLLSGGNGDQGRSVADRGMLKSLDKGGM